MNSIGNSSRYKKSSKCVTFYCQNIIEHFKSRSHKQKLRTAQEQENLEELIKELEDYFLSQEIKKNYSDKPPLVEEQHKLSPVINEKDLYKFLLVEFIIRNRLAYSIGSSLSIFIQELVKIISPNA